MTKVYIESTNITSPLGFTTEENAQKVYAGESGIRLNNDTTLSPKPILASYFNWKEIHDIFQQEPGNGNYTRFEKLAILSIKEAIEKSNIDLNTDRTLFILSTTKGNIDLLSEVINGKLPESRVKLQAAAKVIANYFGFYNKPMVVSNACISGIAAQVVAKRLIADGHYDHIIVNGTDILSRFIVSGFQSFFTLSEQPCKPFDGTRDGLTLGEGSATLIITKNQTNIEMVNGATSNDANHISGPSRTGQGLLVAIENTIKNYNDISFISAHGTGTPYNDDMESKAITRAGLANIPVHSLKGYYGHTLGAAGAIETIISLESIKKNNLIKSLGCETPGTAEKLNIIMEQSVQKNNAVLKLGSGFGGCNAAALFVKNG